MGALQRTKGSSLSAPVEQVTQAEEDLTFPGLFLSLKGGTMLADSLFSRVVD